MNLLSRLPLLVRAVAFLDADERVSLQLAEWIRVGKLDQTSAAAFRLPRRNYYGDSTWMTCCGWFPDEQIRLYRKSKVHYSDRIHRAPDIDGRVEALPLFGEAYLAHLSFPNLTARMEKMNLYSTISAEAMLADGKRIGSFGMVARTLFAFVQAYLLQKGFCFGALGVFLALERSFFAYLKCAKLWELQHKE